MKKGSSPSREPIVRAQSRRSPVHLRPPRLSAEEPNLSRRNGPQGQWFPGEHEAIIDPALFNAVQDLLKSNSVTRRQQRSDNLSLLTGLLFDDRGNRMSPSFSTKRGVRYRFYVSSAVISGRRDEAGSMTAHLGA